MPATHAALHGPAVIGAISQFERLRWTLREVIDGGLHPPFALGRAHELSHIHNEAWAMPG